MNLTSITPAGLPALPTPPTGSPSETSGGMFGRLFDQALQGAAQSHQNAQAAIHDLATGKTDQLHGVLLQVAQADLSFRLILEIRNRLTDAYQEIMKMQV
jgi:flagellar hook-basal body complex protein FliE